MASQITHKIIMMLQQQSLRPHQKARRRPRATKVSLLLLLQLYTTCFLGWRTKPAHAFVATGQRRQLTTVAKRKFSSLTMTLDDISAFYMTRPLESAVITFGVKASVADWIAQFRASVPLTARRNLAYSIYGGLFVGIMCHLEYDYLFPAWFGASNSLTTVAEEVLFDDFVSAPLCWLPPAYVIQATVMEEESYGEALQRYWRDITEKNLLVKYWMIWIPTQSINFSVVPEHLRVVFMASVSFFWFILFSTLCSADAEESATS